MPISPNPLNHKALRGECKNSSEQTIENGNNAVLTIGYSDEDRADQAEFKPRPRTVHACVTARIEHAGLRLE